MIKKILIANRGEIAVRIIRACKNTGIVPIAVYSEQDKHSLHVRLSKDACFLGTGNLQETYKNADIILKAALKYNVDAIHPGYSFLADDPLFAQTVLDNGLKWIGPKPEVLTKLNNKITACSIARSVGFKTVLGSEKPVSDIEEAKSYCRDIGYPVIIKPCYGNGGLGIVVINKAEDLEQGLKKAKVSTSTGFVKDEIFIEKFIENARQVEIGFMADSYGHIIYLPEREVSIQYNYHKLFGESPSNFLTKEQRKEIGELIIKFVTKVGYQNLGNIELHYSNKGEILFDEINPHIQLEHPLTEMIVGKDLVVEQLKIAQDKELNITQSDIKINGHAMEFRINAEDPFNGFHPFTGTIKELEVPGGPLIRFDSNIYRGYSIPLSYDTYLGQLLVWGDSREDTRNRAITALSELSIVGVPTTIVFHRHLLDHPDFITGNFTSNFLKESDIMLRVEEEFRATLAALFAVHKQTIKVTLPSLSKSRWRDSARQEAIGERK